ncbi:class I SAM-dependent methyltransferase [Agrobacterium sp. YIC 4121]|uniref:class I SAM-dependent methyltransferase n=1 Tax=Agrobacterium sp. YIC 4121 TaxID=1923829 RepID=UPI00098F539E|nr:class I SAM-dependent methyltransferase [Agrobacterium sp. YIC 4121]OOO28595.1 SAM-dependent methyltransferase [Agrobacterium sp. YIC 4121]
MAASKNDLTADVAAYYTRTLEEYGATPRGVDWFGEEGQRNRFVQLARLLPVSNFSVNDLGCGYGAFYNFLSENHTDFQYIGYDVSSAMVEAARDVLPKAGVSILQAAKPTQVADFTVASGIFNVRMQRNPQEWQDYIFATLDTIDAASTKGFAFNCLTTYSDVERMRPDLHYTDPLAMFDRCKRLYARNVALLHDYDLWEFTILVRKSA